MQIVSPTYTAPKAKQKRSKKAKAETPEKYRSRYSHQGRKLGGSNYWVRAKDPGAVYAKTMADCIAENKRRRDGRDLRAIIFSENRGSQYYSSVTFGASYQTTAWCEGVPAGSSETDLEELENMSKKEKHANTMNTFGKRIRMLLGTMFDVQEVDTGGRSQYLRSDTITLNCNGNMVYIVPKMED